MEFLIVAIGILCVVPPTLGTNYREKYFDQKIDHFNFVDYGGQTFKQRYLYNDTWWDRGKGPIFFYAGNEGNVVGFWENTGFMFDIAPQFRALILFAEHRFYGNSLPFGNESFTKGIGLLSIQQTLADYAFLITQVKSDFGADNCTVIAFGGSYGGMLAAYMRFKYPNIISGAIAASAPIYQVAGLVPGEVFFRSVTNDFRNALPNCEDQVRTAFAQIKKWADVGPDGLKLVSETFHLCKPLTSTGGLDHFLRWIRNAFVSAAMMDYPYPASFMANFPAYPVKEMCKRLLSGASPAVGLYAATSLYYNSSQSLPCYDIWSEYLYCADPTGCGLGSDSKAWDYQACTEINLEGNTDGINDMFPALPFNSSMRDEYCMRTWKVLPRRNWLKTIFWGEDISSASNIVFSNGNLDPWAAGGVLHDISDTLVTVIVDGGAHHLDLRGHNPADPPSVIQARLFEIANIKRWLQETKIRTSN